MNYVKIALCAGDIARETEKTDPNIYMTARNAASWAWNAHTGAYFPGCEDMETRVGQCVKQAVTALVTKVIFASA